MAAHFRPIFRPPAALQLKKEKDFYHIYKYNHYISSKQLKSKVCNCKINQNTVEILFLLKNAPTCHEGGKNHITPAAENLLSQLCQNTKKTAKTRLTSQCQPLQVKLQVGAKHRTRIKNLLKTCFQKKSDCFWNNLPSSLLKKIRPQIR